MQMAMVSEQAAELAANHDGVGLHFITAGPPSGRCHAKNDRHSLFAMAVTHLMALTVSRHDVLQE
jgi:hypothetical protein